MAISKTILKENFNYLRKGYFVLFENKIYYLISFFVSLVFFLFTVWSGNIGTIFDLVFSSKTNFVEKLDVLYSFTSAISTNFSTPNAVLIVLISIFLGINFSLIIFYFRKRVLIQGSSAGTLGFLGFFSAILGAGCSACGFALILPMLTFFGVSGVLAFLPLHGGEIYIISLLFLLLSCFILMKKIISPLVCPVK